MPHAARNRRQWFGPALLIAGCLLLAAYFIEHAFHGRYGLETWRRLAAEEATLSREVAALEAHRERLARDVRHLSHPPHPDLIEEGAREILGFEATGSVVLARPAP